MNDFILYKMIKQKGNFHVSEIEPTNVLEGDMWYQDIGNADVSNSFYVENASVNENEPSDSSLWFRTMG